MSDKQRENPYIKHQNYAQGYQDSVDKMNSDPTILNLQKLAYLTFSTEHGKQFLNELTERYLIPGFVNPNGPHPDKSALYFEGFKECLRMQRNFVKAHEQFIEAESKEK